MTQQRQPRTESAAALLACERRRRLRLRAALLRRRVRGVDRALHRVGEVVGRRERAVGDAAVDVVVPAVGVVVADDHRGARPVGRLLQRVDLVDDELLLVGGVGIRCMAVLVAGRLQVGDRRQRRRGQRAGA